MTLFFNVFKSYTSFMILSLLTLTGCGGDTGLTPHIEHNTQNNTTANLDGTPSTPQIAVSEITIEHNNSFHFLQDTGNRSDKVVGLFEFTLRDVTNGRFIRNLNNSNMTFLERQLGSDEAFIMEVEATQSSEITVTPIDVMYLIDTSFSVVQANAGQELITQANNLANEINNRNQSTGAVSDTIRYRTFADSVTPLQTSTAANPFDQMTFEERGGGTALYEGIELALSDLSTSAQPILFVFTDGRENASSPGYNLALILNSAANRNIPIYIAGLGNVDSNVLNQIAITSGGQFFQAESVEQLPNVFEDVLYSIPAQYNVRYKPTQRTGHIEFQFVVEYGDAFDMITGDFNVDHILSQ